MAVLSILFWQMFESGITIFSFHTYLWLFQKGCNTYEVLLSWSEYSCYIRMWMTGIIDIRIIHPEYIFAFFHEIKSKGMRSHWSNSMTAQAFICSKCTTLCCKGKFLVSYQTVKSWRILLFERKYVCWMYFCFFIKLTQGEWGLADPTQWQCKLSFAKNVRHLLQRKVFGSLSKGQIMRDFIIWKEICILNVFLLFHKTESRRMRSHWLNSMTVQTFFCKNVRHLLQRKVFGFLSKGQIMRDFIIWKEIWKTLNKETRR